MIELLRSNDLVFLSFVEALMRDAGVETVQMDAHASNIEGSVSAIERRLMVPKDREAVAKDILNEARRELATRG